MSYSNSMENHNKVIEITQVRCKKSPILWFLMFWWFCSSILCRSWNFRFLIWILPAFRPRSLTTVSAQFCGPWSPNIADYNHLLLFINLFVFLFQMLPNAMLCWARWKAVARVLHCIAASSSTPLVARFSIWDVLDTGYESSQIVIDSSWSRMNRP